MLWQHHFPSNDALVEYLKQESDLSDSVCEAMKKVDRKSFVDSTQHEYCYDVTPLSIGHGATISAPNIHSRALSLLEPQLKPGKRFLDVGCGSGIMLAYVAALMDIKNASSSVMSGIDLIAELVELTRRNLRRWDPKITELGNVFTKVANGWHGDAGNAPFNAIHVGAAARGLPKELLAQLVPNGGLMVFPYEVEHYEHYLLLVERGPIAQTDTSHLPHFQDGHLRKYLKTTSMGNPSRETFVDNDSGLWYVRMICACAFVPLQKSSPPAI
eukprot:Gregarina_sp_Pseudo_9__1753@NODE_2190_length_1106_cov_53_833177_g2018_i0_p1_GENE_NODE_2190_length_1106_cov_53_833177_g2018_i0NODE_2190_length_1106_cov_53_833177_g2018_i0_p1_ORF_typecomplete_len271_score13_98PCMT/PF01135_19/9e47MTS/PF05175_14/2_2e07Methyltransf_31/PF13847_6/1_9e07Methyltransf_23/PF13489_6/5_7e07PrmA/PF06325_13/5_8e07DOT1/PF08123_13/2_2e06Methyltransf_25/PF13649_6/2_8e05UPF0020/PF01170_18/0_00046N6_Mtase/PF02384_16/0_00038AviRa/PF11599_8/0_001Ubie_methyltran/PF01209_18/0_0017CMAS/